MSIEKVREALYALVSAAWSNRAIPIRDAVQVGDEVQQALDEAEALRAERDRLREALEASNKYLAAYMEQSDALPRSATLRRMKDNRALLETDHE